MAKPVNKQARTSNPFTHVERAKLGSNKFDISHDVKTTFKMGWCTPIMCIETIPNDYFEIKSEIMVRFAPLVLPIMHRCDLRVNYFYVPNRIIFPEWTKFIVGEAIEYPSLQVNITPTVTTSLYQYLGYPGAGDFNQKISALPFAAYAAIWDLYYRNPQIQTERFQPLVAGVNPYYDYDNLDILRYQPWKVNWNRDYFTSALPMPQAGEDVLIPAAEFAVGVGNNLPLEFQRIDGVTATGGSTISLDFTTPRKVRDSSGELLQPNIQPHMGNIREFRLASMMQEWLEKINRTGTRYRDYLKGFFGSDPSPLSIDDPVWIGSSMATVVISEVMQTAQTIDSTNAITSPTGAYGGQALAFKSTDRIKYKCYEHGLIIANIDITPKTSYFKGLSRIWRRTTYLDYPFPQFAHIGDQAIRSQEVWNGSILDSLGVFGYIPRYSEYRYGQDIVSGQMQGLFLDFHLGRNFTETTGLNEEFVECTPRVSDVFILPDNEHECYAHIFHNVTVDRQLPRFGIPKL